MERASSSAAVKILSSKQAQERQRERPSAETERRRDGQIDKQTGQTDKRGKTGRRAGRASGQAWCVVWWWRQSGGGEEGSLHVAG